MNAVLIGLPEHGKSTYLIALFCQLTSDDVENALELSGSVSDREYVNALAAEYLRCERLSRTHVPAEPVIFPLRGRADGADLTVVVPDLLGEKLESQFADRVWDPGFAQHAESAGAVLLFVHPEHVREPTSVATALATAKALGDLGDDAADDDEAIEFDPRMCPTQVQLVDLLQAARSKTQSDRLPVAVIVSAWDCVKRTEPAMSPAEWLAKRLPLLSQYLVANRDRSPHRVFGVSAQGGRLPEQADELLAKRPGTRPIVRDDSGEHCDLTVPLLWLASAQGRRTA
jgi:hypothetical protein